MSGGIYVCLCCDNISPDSDNESLNAAEVTKLIYSLCPVCHDSPPYSLLLLPLIPTDLFHVTQTWGMRRWQSWRSCTSHLPVWLWQDIQNCYILTSWRREGEGFLKGFPREILRDGMGPLLVAAVSVLYYCVMKYTLPQLLPWLHVPPYNKE